MDKDNIPNDKIERVKLFDNNVTSKDAVSKVANANSKRNSLYNVIRRADGSEFLDLEAFNETMFSQSLELALRTLTSLNNRSNFTEIAHNATPRRIDDDPLFNDDGLSVPSVKGRYIFGVMLATDGGDDNMVYDVVQHSSGFDLSKVIPFRYVEREMEDAVIKSSIGQDEFYGKYCLRNTETFDNKTYAMYYAKRLDFEIFVTDALSGMPINGYPDDVTIDTGRVNTTGVADFDITKTDFLEFFTLKHGDRNARTYNSFIFLSGSPVEYTLSGKTFREFRNVVASHKINIKTVYLGEEDIRGYKYEQRF